MFLIYCSQAFKNGNMRTIEVFDPRPALFISMRSSVFRAPLYVLSGDRITRWIIAGYLYETRHV